MRPFPTAGGKFPISTGGGSEPVWSRDRRELFYRNGDKMMAATITIGSTLVVGAPRLLFEGHYEASDTGAGGYDVTSDRRFLMIEIDFTAATRDPHHCRVELVRGGLKRTIASDTK